MCAYTLHTRVLSKETWQVPAARLSEIISCNIYRVLLNNNIGIQGEVGMKHPFTVWGLLDAPKTSWVTVLVLEERRNPGSQTGPWCSARPTDAIINTANTAEAAEKGRRGGDSGLLPQ